MPRQTNQLGRLQESLVLFKYMLHLFGCNDLKALSADLKDPALEGTNDEGGIAALPCFGAASL